MGNLGVSELIFLFILALVLFGPRKLPELGRTLGKALAEFRKARTDFGRVVEDEMREWERHAREIEARANEPVAPAASSPALAEAETASGAMGPPSHDSAALKEPAGAAARRSGENPADGDPNPA